MGKQKLAPNTGRKVLFIGGPEAGNVRLVPEADGDYLQADNDYVYRIWPMAMRGDKRIVYFAYAANEHPINMMVDLWREYSPAAQIRRETDENAITYRKVTPI